MFKYYKYKLLRLLHLMSKKKYQKKMAKYTRGYKTIARSKLFDKKWYLEQNPDVAQAGADPVEHYLNTGWKENRRCTPYFDGAGYIAMYPDVLEANINPLVHWLLHGQFENRYAEVKPVKAHYLQAFGQKIRSIAVYPITVYEECQRLSEELKNLR